MRWWLVGIGAACACAPTHSDDPCLGGDAPTVAVGAGDGAFAPLAAGDPLELVRGPQGGVHLTLGLQATGLDPSEPVEATLSGEVDGADVALALPFVFFRCNREIPALQAWDLRLIYDAPPEDLAGRTSAIHVELVDRAGRTATGDTTVEIVGPQE